MRDWKELGEVPDSDDESLDNLESQDEVQPEKRLVNQHGDAQQPLPLQQLDEAGPHSAIDDIWDIPPTPEQEKREEVSEDQNVEKPASVEAAAPESNVKDLQDVSPLLRGVAEQTIPLESTRETSPTLDFDGPPFSPLSSAPSDIDEIDDIDELGILPPALALGRVGPRERAFGNNGASTVTKPAVTFEEDEISTPYVTITAPLPGRPVSDPVPAARGPVSTTPASNRSTSPSSILRLALVSGINDPTLTWAESPVRGRRSLRPRKPIQQHPYLLESVQYAHAMKSHGVKPVRVIVPAASPSRRLAADDSQDREFEEQSSEEQVGDRRADVTDESQPILFDDMDDDRDKLGLSPSPPRTSPRNMFQNSSQRSEADRTDNTSILEDDFPAVEDLARRPHKPRVRILKRQLSSKLQAHRKRVPLAPTTSAESSPPVPRYKHVSIDPPSSPATAGLYASSQDLGVEGTPQSTRTPTFTTAAAPSRQASSTSWPRQDAVDLTVQNEDDSSSGSESTSSHTSSKSGSEVIRRNVKRIRGVLPASWLRIDQQKSNGPKQRRTRRTPEASPEPEQPRRGVAIRKVSSRVGSPRPSTSITPLFSDDSDDNEVTTVRTKPATRQESPDDAPLVIWSDQEDAGSVVEEDHIDRMFVGTKRNRTSLDSPTVTKRQKTTRSNTFKVRTGGQRRQPRITDVLERAGSKSSTAARTISKAKKRQAGSHNASRAKAPTKRALTPPLLSVLDVMDSESKAPPFLKIAARTAKRRQDLGKGSPTHKHINLGTRKDNVDALSVLRDWKSGRIRSKMSKPATSKAAARHPLQNLSTNYSPNLAQEAGHFQQSASGAERLEAIGLDGDNEQDALKRRSGPRKTVLAARTHSWSARPAQLETEEQERPDRVDFHARKRALDVLFRNARRTSSASSVRLEQQWDSIRLANGAEESRLEPSIQGSDEPRPLPQRKNVKSRFRKRAVPKPVDLQAAHYVRANDPLPLEELGPAVVIPDEAEGRPPVDKLYGLAPYGTKYTYHFEVFPLDRGVYFHSSSIIGGGWLHKITHPQYLERTRQTRQRAFFTMDGKDFRWGPWDETASSELGILVDWIAEQLLSPETAQEDVSNVKPRDAAAFLLAYVVDSIGLPDEDSEKSFILRMVEVMDGFLSRVEEAGLSDHASTKLRKNTVVDVLTRLTLMMHAVLRISGSTMSLKFQIETLLTRTAKACITGLLAGGLEDLRTLYGDLQHLSARERGIRSDCISANSWAVLMRVLENARIPRASFWDVTHGVMVGFPATSGSDVRAFESLWHDMFTLLPLSEVDDLGVVKSGSRHTAPVEGWTLPQKLLKRVFSLYTANPRQPPSFNEYCRALAARCHYLVHEWGWRKCAGIVGTWFDFFGSQNLHHLRNEEVHKSPRFLEELTTSPSLDIDPEDRCFHIFLKVLASVIQRLKKLGLTNDIRNLVARTMPNHNRQYLKEDTVHQRDLAALRNHHDLLCTLFWAAPPELRPAAHLIEKLVSPGSSHKEACLINLRAWRQLAQFVVSSGEGSAVFRPFVSWQNNIFGQVLDQYLSAASDIQKQILALPKDGPRIGDEVIDSMVKQNRSVAMDMLFVSVKSSFEVLKLAGSLNAATYVLNICQ
jgi:hypothetical protein